MTSPDYQTAHPAPEERQSVPDPSEHGLRDTTQLETPPDAAPEQSSGGEETQPDGLEPKAGYPKADPRHEDKPYRP